MNLPSLSSSRSLRGLVVVAAVAALSVLTVACGDDDDDDDAGVHAGSGGSSGSGGKSGNGGKGGKGGSGGVGGRSGGGTGGSSGSGGSGGAVEEDAGMTEDAGEEPGPNPNAFRNVTFQMSGLTTGAMGEVGKFMQFRLISAGGDLINVSVIHGVPTATFDFELPHSAPAGEVVTVEVWADTAGTVENAYDAGMDHAWTATIAAGAANEDAVVPIAGGAQPTPPTLTDGAATGSLGFTMMMNTNDHMGELFELRVIENDSGRLVGRQLLGIPGNEIGLEVYGVLRTGIEYQVDYAIDLDGNLAYDAPPTDAAWRQVVTATATGYSGGPGATISLSDIPSSDDYVDVGF